jgi:2-polyprenyl-3-methyl-5-hydroxy-6-metoxy-1,4-benzoquinol methylase
MTYTPEEFLAIEIKNGIHKGNPAFRELAKVTVSQVENLGIVTVLDYGAGTGVYSDAYYKAGYSIVAFEIWEAHRNYIKEKFPHLPITDTLITTDLLNFIETSEHMTDTELEFLFSAIHPKYILFSSTSDTSPLDIEWGHINLKSQEKWVEFFKNLGYELVKDLTYPTPWTKLFKYVK